MKLRTYAFTAWKPEEIAKHSGNTCLSEPEERGYAKVAIRNTFLNATNTEIKLSVLRKLHTFVGMNEAHAQA